MDDVMEELVGITLTLVDPLMLPVCRAVCRRWLRALQQSAPAQQNTGLQPGPSFSRRVATRGWLSVLQWAHANGCRLNEATCSGAAQAGHLEVLQWARGVGCPWDSADCATRARLGRHWPLLQWVHGVSGCDIDQETCTQAAAHNRQDVVAWARGNGGQWDERTTAADTWSCCDGCPWPTAAPPTSESLHLTLSLSLRVYIRLVCHLHSSLLVHQGLEVAGR
jgi:hypothetical protein